MKEIVDNDEVVNKNIVKNRELLYRLIVRWCSHTESIHAQIIIIIRINNVRMLLANCITMDTPESPPVYRHSFKLIHLVHHLTGYTI